MRHHSFLRSLHLSAISIALLFVSPAQATFDPRSVIGNNNLYYCRENYSQNQTLSRFATIHRVKNGRKIGFQTALDEVGVKLRAIRRRITRNKSLGISTVALNKRLLALQQTRNDLQTCKSFLNTGKPFPEEASSYSCTAAGGVDGLGLRTINGNQCWIGDSPVRYIGLLDSSGQEFASCSGTVVRVPGASAARAVIFAAHCADGIAGIDLHVPGGRMRASTFGALPGWSYSQNTPFEDGDAALALFDSDIPTDSFEAYSGTIEVGERVVFAGYGLDDFGIATRLVLRAGSAVLSATTSYGLTITYDGSASNTCNGDSGGPLLVQRNGIWYLAGMVSNGARSDCSVGDVSNFSRLGDQKIKDWINAAAPGLVP